MAVLAIPALLLGLARTVHAQAPAVAEEIRRRVELLREGRPLVLAGAPIASGTNLASLYEERTFAPLWTDTAVAAELLRVIREAATDGLDPLDYHLETIDGMPRVHPSAAAEAEADLLMSDALAGLAHDLRFGRVDPGTLPHGWRIPRGADSLPAAMLQAMVTRGDLAATMDSLRPSHFIYRGLQGALADYRELAVGGGWQPLPAGPTLRVDSAGPRVAMLRRRLAVEGDLTPHSDTTSEVFDSVLDAAVRRFQHRHALNEDGVVGPGTLRELNVPVETRIDQIRINLERARWVLHDLEDAIVAVNIAGQRTYLVEHGGVVWESRAIVGRSYTRTPVFAAAMRYIVLNPTWTVPPGIVGEVLAAVRADPDYLRRERMRILNPAGRVVDPSSIDFTRMTARNFPYTFRQDAGPANPLGRIKFMFPNEHNVYLHDTPARALFDREDRTFSHGCIRVQDPLRLAELLLGDAGWDRTGLEAAIATGETRTIQLPAPVPTLMLYWTASTDLHGELHYYRDVYGRDAALLEALGPDT
jgi:murein L,D-transpeptidase YcbB/YkuD